MGCLSISEQNGEGKLRVADAEDCGQGFQTRPHWYAIYNCANHEKKVAEQLALRGAEHFLPVYESVRRWKDRKVRLVLPLFPGYVFVRMALQDRFRILQIPSVACLVGFGGVPAELSENEIAQVRELLQPEHRAQPFPYLRAGQRVRVCSGPLRGLKGSIVRRANGNRFVISLDAIQRSMAIELAGLDLQPVASLLQKKTALVAHV
jgi:transcription antitermination factor NusG